MISGVKIGSRKNSGLPVFKGLRRTSASRVPDLQRLNTYRDLSVWHRSNELVRLVFYITGNTTQASRFPEQNTDTRDSRNELLSIIRSTALHIPISIARGHTSGNKTHFAFLLEKSRCDLATLDTQIVLAQQMEFISFEDRKKTEVLIHEINAMLLQLKRRIRDQSDMPVRG